MQLQGLMLILFMLIITPVIILTSSTNAFFITLALAILAASIKTMHSVFFGPRQSTPSLDEDDFIEELEEILNLDLRKIGIGIKVVRNLIVILFFVYCLFYVHLLLLKIILLAIILYWLLGLVGLLYKNNESFLLHIPKFIVNLYAFTVNFGSIILIIFVTHNKFISNHI